MIIKLNANKSVFWMKKVKINREKVLNLTIGLLCVGGMVFFAIFSSLPKEIKKPQKVVGVLYMKSPATRGFDAVFCYYVNGVKYELRKDFEICFILGQKYSVMFDKNNPSNAMVMLKEPIFNDNDITDKTFAVITNLGTEFFSNKSVDVEIEYTVNGQNYHTYQYSDWDKYNVKVGDKCELEYLVENPAICIIHLDRKIK